MAFDEALADRVRPLVQGLAVEKKTGSPTKRRWRCPIPWMR